MTALVDTVEAALFGPCGVEPGQRVLAACSGGRDSAVLLHALAELAASGRIRLAAATVDHGLRDDGGAVAARVERWCDALGVCWTGLTVTLDPALLRARGVEAAARDARRAALVAAADASDCEVVALGHHRQDQAETVLMRAVVGTGLRGLSAMRPRSGRFVRPLLVADPDHIEAFAVSHGIDWIEDPGNTEERFLRNRLRRRVLPVLVEEVGPAAVTQLARLADRCAADDEVLSSMAREHRRRAARGDGVSAAALEGLAAPLVVRMLASMVREFEPAAQLGEVHLRAGLQLVRGPDREAGVDLPGGLRLERGGDAVRVVRHEGPCPDPGPPVPLAVPGVTPWPVAGLEVCASVHGDRAQVGRGPAPGRVRAWFDLDRLTTPLCMHKFALGSRMRPYGGPGSRKVSDLMSEAGIPRRLRGGWPVVADAHHLLWVPGVRAAEHGAVTDATERILDLEMGENR